ncbi:MAG: DUF928 domain-containing protein [Cyanobacteria bacterium CRU_2_1]|nr:DUF928 domain-containing protein [Cyanobacteria bacterium CRU_2_1]
MRKNNCNAQSPQGFDRSLIVTTIVLLSLLGLSIHPPSHALTWDEFRHSWNEFWTNALNVDPPVPPENGGGRGDEACPIAPLLPSEIATVWSDRPTFVWNGEIAKLEIRSRTDQSILWNASILGLHTITYSGEALQSGQQYEWLVYLPAPSGEPYDTPTFVIPFQVMTPTEQEKIATDLEQLNEQLNEQFALTATTTEMTTETLILHRANFFAKHQLWSDFWHEVFSVEDRSPALDRLIEETMTALCEAPA